MSENVVEYAILAQQCYNLARGNAVLPQNWSPLFHWSPKGGWENLYAMFVNEANRELVLAIRGTENLFNLLTDASLIAGALTGNFQVPPGQQDLEMLANSIHFHLTHQFMEENSESTYDLQEIGQAIQSFDRQIAPQIENWVLALLYIAAITVGLYNINQVVPLPLVGRLAVGAALTGISITSLRQIGTQVTERLLMILGDKTPSSLATLKSTTSTWLEKHYKDYTFKIVGHSLGGIMAELCAAEIGVSCITFESPGSKEIMNRVDRYRVKLEQGLQIINYLSAPNIINTLNEHSGISYRMLLPHTEGGFSYIHGANCLFHSGSRIATYLSLGAFGYGKMLAAKGIEKGMEVAALKYSEKALVTAVGTRLAAGVAGLWKDSQWLMRQHKIDNIVRYLSGSPQLREVISWPRVLMWNRFWNDMKDFTRSTVLPLQRDLPGVRNLLNEEGMREAQIERMEGYEVR